MADSAAELVRVDDAEWLAARLFADDAEVERILVWYAQELENFRWPADRTYFITVGRDVDGRDHYRVSCQFCREVLYQHARTLGTDSNEALKLGRPFVYDHHREAHWDVALNAIRAAGLPYPPCKLG